MGLSRRLRALRLVVPAVLATLEVSHPTWSAGTVSEAVVASGGLWIPLHLLLGMGYFGLVCLLWVPSLLPRIMLGAFLLCNTAFLVVDGVGVGVLATFDPGAAERLWDSPLVVVLANLTGAAWAASLLSVAPCVSPAGRSRPALLGLGATWLTFIASATPLAMPFPIDRAAALTTGAGAVYARGGSGVPFALLVFAAVLHQHVGPEAALGMLLVGVALARLPRTDDRDGRGLGLNALENGALGRLWSRCARSCWDAGGRLHRGTQHRRPVEVSVPAVPAQGHDDERGREC